MTVAHFTVPLIHLTAIVISLLVCWSPCVHPQSMPIAINSDSSNYGGNMPPFRPPPGPPPPPQSSFNPISAILGNLFGGLSSFSIPPGGGGGGPGGTGPGGPQFMTPMGPGGMPIDVPREQRPHSQVECSVTSMPPGMANGFAGHLTKSYKNNPDYMNNIDPSSSSPSSNRTGICVNNPYDCKNRQGNILGPCFGRRAQGLPRMPMGICCNFESTCGQVISANGSHFKSPKFPNPYSDPGSCTVTVKNTYSNICQIRLDFDVFNLKQPVNGNCNSDRFVVSGQPNNIIVPSICGYNPGQHMYIDIDEMNRDSFSQPSPPTLLTLNVITSGMRHRWFDIRVSYIPCDSDFRAPTNCLQYFTSMVGQIKSFNYDMFNQGFTYFNNLDYTMCFKKWPGFCTIIYEVQDNDEWGNANGNGSDDDDFLNPDSGDMIDYDEKLKKGPPVQATTPSSSNGKGKNKKKVPQQFIRPSREETSFHIVPREYGSQSQSTAAAGPLKCNTDYLSINNLRFCGHHLNEAGLYSSSIRSDAPVMDNSTGPLQARFVTSTDNVGKGFALNYQLNPCLMAG